MKQNHWTKYRGINAKIGMILSLGLILLAFEWKTYSPAHIISIDYAQDFEEQPLPPPPTQQLIPPPPPKILPQIIEVKEEDIEEELEDVVLDMDIDLDTEIPLEPLEEIEVIDEPIEPVCVLIAEQPAAPEGGMKAFMEYMGRNLKYPKKARRMGVQGRVILEFIVDTDGQLSDVKVLRGIGAGCDEEAKRLLEAADPWMPAKQRGRRVRQKMTIPVFFKLK